MATNKGKKIESEYFFAEIVINVYRETSNERK